MDELEKVKLSKDAKVYEHTVTLVFWFAIHLENLGLCQLLIDKEFLLK